MKFFSSEAIEHQPYDCEVLKRCDLLGLVDVAVVGLQLLADGFKLGVGGDELVNGRLRAPVDQKVELLNWKKIMIEVLNNILIEWAVVAVKGLTYCLQMQRLQV